MPVSSKGFVTKFEFFVFPVFYINNVLKLIKEINYSKYSKRFCLHPSSVHSAFMFDFRNLRTRRQRDFLFLSPKLVVAGKVKSVLHEY